MLYKDFQRLAGFGDEATDWWTSFTSGLKDLSTGAANVINAIQGEQVTAQVPQVTVTPKPTLPPAIPTTPAVGTPLLLVGGALAVGAAAILLLKKGKRR